MIHSFVDTLENICLNFVADSLRQLKLFNLLLKFRHVVYLQSETRHVRNRFSLRFNDVKSVEVRKI